MEKYFNTTGICVETIHYMVNIDNKIKKIKDIINRDSYFVINRPRQFGKTTTLNILRNYLSKDYIVIYTSFEGIGDKSFSDEKLFCNKFLNLMIKSLKRNNKEESDKLKKLFNQLNDFDELSDVITEFIDNSSKEVILIIDEVDKSSNNQLFLSFLGMLRSKYLMRSSGDDVTFKSVILAGVHDVKTLKIKIRENDEVKLNSPWNIAVNFDIDMSFNINEIKSMISDYSDDYNLNMNVDKISKEIYFFTNGYPFLVSRVCQIIDENLYPTIKKSWTIKDIHRSVKLITLESNTLFESIIKNLENNPDLYNLIRRILVNGESIVFNQLDPVINLGITYGIFDNKNDTVQISNKIFEEILYNYMVSKLTTQTKDMSLYNFKKSFTTADGGLNMDKVLLKFQQYMKENYSSLDDKFIEREGRIIFMAFLSPIINGIGFTFKEAQVSKEKRLDIVVTYNNFKYIVELKIYRGEKYHKEGVDQLIDYLDLNNLNKGYLIAFNFNNNKEYKTEHISKSEKDILSVFV